MVGTKSELFAVGLTGKNAAGKGEAAAVLQRAGYLYRSLSDIVREEVGLLGLSPSRDNLITTANELRRKHGPGVLAERTAPLLADGTHVIDSIRHPEEVRILARTGSFLLIAVDAPIELRFERARKRGRDESAGTLEEFRRTEDRERTGERNAQQLDAAFALADHVVVNDRTLPDLEAEILGILRLHGFPISRKTP